MLDNDNEEVDDINNNQHCENINDVIDINACSVNNVDMESSSLWERTFFYRLELIHIDDKEFEDVELLNFCYPFHHHLYEDIKKKICSFLNSSHGGRIYMGITNKSLIIKGLIIEPQDKELIIKQMNEALEALYSKCNPSHIKILFIPIKDFKSSKFIPKLYIIKIIVKKGIEKQLYSITSKGYFPFIRINGKCVGLSSQEIIEEIMKRNQPIPLDINNIEDIDNEAEEEIEWNDPQPEIPSQENTQSKKKIVNIMKFIPNQITLKIDQISKSCSVTELDAVFSATKYISKRIFNDTEGMCVGWAYFNYPTIEAAVNAMNQLKNVKIKGKKMVMKIKND